MLEREGGRLRGEVGIDCAKGGELVRSVGNVGDGGGRAAGGGNGGAAAAEAGVRFAAVERGGGVLPGIDGVGGRGRWRTPVRGLAFRRTAAAGSSHRRRLVYVGFPPGMSHFVIEIFGVAVGSVWILDSIYLVNIYLNC